MKKWIKLQERKRKYVFDGLCKLYNGKDYTMDEFNKSAARLSHEFDQLSYHEEPEKESNMYTEEETVYNPYGPNRPIGQFKTETSNRYECTYNPEIAEENGLGRALMAKKLLAVLEEYRLGATNVSIKEIIFNGPATIVLWEDGTKTVVKCMRNEEHDVYAAVAQALAKKLYGSTSAFHKIVDSLSKYQTYTVGGKETYVVTANTMKKKKKEKTK